MINVVIHTGYGHIVKFVSRISRSNQRALVRELLKYTYIIGHGGFGAIYTRIPDIGSRMGWGRIFSNTRDPQQALLILRGQDECELSE